MTGELLDHARRLIAGSGGPSGVWPRAAALLARQALEDALDRLWTVVHPAMKQSSRRTQMICLGMLLKDEALIADVRAVWSSLSRACHHHHYELAPTAPELEGWIQQTEHLLTALEPLPPPNDKRPQNS